jgi:hypothetical protein
MIGFHGVPDDSGTGSNRGIRRDLIFLAVGSVILLSGIAIVFLGQPATVSSQERVVGDCSGARTANVPYLFLVSTPDGLPVQNVTITASGVSGVTNSSGVTILPATDITLLETRLAGTSSSVSLGGYESSLLCLGDSYYRLVSLSANVTGGTNP